MGTHPYFAELKRLKEKVHRNISTNAQISAQDGWRGGPSCNSDDFSFFSLSLGLLEAEIQVFSGSLSENDRKSINERDHKFYCTPVIFECAVNFFFPTWKNVPGAYSERFSEIIGNREHPEKVVSFKKEAERG